MVRNIKLALLICDTPIEPVRQKYGTYREVFEALLSKSLPSQDTPNFTLDGYDVVREEYPDVQKLVENEGYDAILISGSATSAYEDLPWIARLRDYIRNLVSNYAHIQLFGICFGHQMIASAMGGEVIPNPKGWEVGTTQISLTEEGKRIFGVESGSMNVTQMHRDHVPYLPPSFELLASNWNSPNHGMVLKYPSSTPSSNAGEPHVLTIQGHPEFTPDIVHKIVDFREAAGRMNPVTAAKGRACADIQDDGVSVIGKVIWGIILKDKQRN